MKHLSYLLLIVLSSTAFAQTPLLERRVTIAVVNERIDALLQRISREADFTFSYSPSVVDASRVVTFSFVNQSVRQVLDEIFEGTIQYKVRGNYIILSAARSGAVQKTPATVSGYVVDQSTGERLKNVSVYDPVTLASTVTDAYGYFEIDIQKPASEIILSVNRVNYTDTLVTVPSGSRLLNIPISIDKQKVSALADSVSYSLKRFWKGRSTWLGNVNVENIDDTLYRTMQISFVPFVGSNHRMSGNVINHYSLNILGGYALGVRNLEVGGVFNLVRGDVRGAQFAGVMNQVGGTLEGAQFAGVLNINESSVRGATFGGVLNIHADNAEGAAFAGVGNITSRRHRGSQISGVFNLTGRDGGPFQLAGVLNVAGKNMKGFQGAGVMNIAGKNMAGTQLAGVFNVTGKEVRGSQISGVLNVAKNVRGAQIGLINIADSAGGVPFGLLSIVGKGYHKIEISADEIFYNNLAFRSGVRQFYNILTVGAKPSTYQTDETFWTFGYGVGTAPKIARKLFLNFDLTSNQLVRGNSIQALELLNKLYVGFDYQIFRKVSFTFGATLNGYLAEDVVDGRGIFTDYQPDIFYRRHYNSGHYLSMWLGGKAGLRFF